MDWRQLKYLYFWNPCHTEATAEVSLFSLNVDIYPIGILPKDKHFVRMLNE